MLWACACAAAAPVHPPLPDGGLTGLDGACGAAVDREGNVYVAGAAGIDVFSPEREILASIPDADEPCALALDEEGNLYASERATGDVVRYAPDEFPFADAPAYGAPVTVDPSGEAEGIAVDPFDGRLYVAKGDRVDLYNADDSLGIDEVQRLNIDAPSGGSVVLWLGPYTGEVTYANAETFPAELQERLEGLSSIGPGGVSVTGTAEWRSAEYEITFLGPLGRADIPPLAVDDFDLQGNPDEEEEGNAWITTLTEGFDGHIRPQTGAGEDLLEQATGVAAYTYDDGEVEHRHLFVADRGGEGADRVHLLRGVDFRELAPTRVLEGASGKGFDFGPEGALLAADPGTCPAVGQACTAGHFFVPDAGHGAIYEFEATGHLFSQLPMQESQPVGIAVDRSGGAGDGRLYVPGGKPAGSRLFAFGPVPPAPRPARPDLSLVVPSACGVAVDSYGNRYVAAGSAVYVYPPSGDVPLTTIAGLEDACELAVDSDGHVYVLDLDPDGQGGDRVVYFTPESFPPSAGSAYAGPTVVATGSPGTRYHPPVSLRAIALDPVDDHLFVSDTQSRMAEFDSAENGSGPLSPYFSYQFEPYVLWSIARIDDQEAVATWKSDRSLYIAQDDYVLHVARDGRILGRIRGQGSPGGTFGPLGDAALAVDPASGHLLLFRPERGAWEEYEPSGTFVGEFGELGSATGSGIAVDDGPFSPNRGTVYVARDDSIPGGFEVAAFDPLVYPQPPRPPVGPPPPVEEPPFVELPPSAGFGGTPGQGQGSSGQAPAAAPPPPAGSRKRCRPGKRRAVRRGRVRCVSRHASSGKGPGRIGPARPASRGS